MALEVWFDGDIENVIVGVAGGMLDSAIEQGNVNIEYCKGVLGLAKHYSRAFGLNWRQALLEIGEGVNDKETRAIIDSMVRLLPHG